RFDGSAICCIDSAGTMTVSVIGRIVCASLFCSTWNVWSVLLRFTMPTFVRYLSLIRWPRMATALELMREVSIVGNVCDTVQVGLSGCGDQMREVTNTA